MLIKPTSLTCLLMNISYISHSCWSYYCYCHPLSFLSSSRVFIQLHCLTHWTSELLYIIRLSIDYVSGRARIRVNVLSSDMIRCNHTWSPHLYTYTFWVYVCRGPCLYVVCLGISILVVLDAHRLLIRMEVVVAYWVRNEGGCIIYLFCEWLEFRSELQLNVWSYFLNWDVSLQPYDHRVDVCCRLFVSLSLPFSCNFSFVGDYDNRYTVYTFIGIRHHVIDRHESFNTLSTLRACADLFRQCNRILQ